MGNMIRACIVSDQGSFPKVIYWEGNTKIHTRKRLLAGEIMFEFPESMVCDADRFFIGHTIPALSIDDQLKPGKTYFVLPLDIFSTEILTASSISTILAHTPKVTTPSDLKECPLEYINGSNGGVLIKVKPEFLARHLASRGGGGHDDDDDQEKEDGNSSRSSLCSTPELKKEYKQLVRSKDQTWSPNLKTISEAKKIWYSPSRVIGLMEWKEKDEEAYMHKRKI